MNLEFLNFRQFSSECLFLVLFFIFDNLVFTFLTKISILTKIFLPKLRFFLKISIYDQNLALNFCPKNGHPKCRLNFRIKFQREFYNNKNSEIPWLEILDLNYRLKNPGLESGLLHVLEPCVYFCWNLVRKTCNFSINFSQIRIHILPPKTP